MIRWKGCCCCCCDDGRGGGGGGLDVAVDVVVIDLAVGVVMIRW